MQPFSILDIVSVEIFNVLRRCEKYIQRWLMLFSATYMHPESKGFGSIEFHIFGTKS